MANFDAAKAIFSLVDTNKDGSIDPNEFQSWVAGSDATNGLSSSSYESSSFQSSTGGLDASANLTLNGETNLAGASGFESSDGLAIGGLANAYESSSSSSNELLQTSGTALETSSVQQTTHYSSTNGIFNDPNPQIIRRAATGGVVTYQQKILVKFLQPPPIPPPGPLIIKEIRPPQPPPPPPLIIRQKAPPLPQPPPLILRERPPVPPAAVASQTIIRRLAALPVPPRSVITERLPPLPPKPRDIIIERWVPYGAQAKRRTIIQRAAAAKEYAKPRNLIVVYDTVQVRVVRQFQRFGVTQEDPQAYLARYGASLLDSSSLVQQARVAGVVEDISPPLATTTFASSQFNASTSGIATGYGYSNSTAEGISDLEGIQVVGGGTGGNYSSQSFSSSSSSTTSNLGSDEGKASGAGFDVAAASFVAADTNKDGSLDQGEFQRFVQGGL